MSAILGKPFDWIVTPFAGFGPLAALVWVSLIASVVLVLAFRWLSNQAAVEQAKNRIKAHMLELRLFRHDVRVVWSAQKQVVWANGSYLKSVLKPFLVTLPVFAWFLLQMEGWFAVRPLHSGEAAIVSVFLKDNSAGPMPAVAIRPGEGVSVETPALRIPSQRRLDWRIRALKAGRFAIDFEIAGKSFRKTIAVADGSTLVRTASVAGGDWMTILGNSQEERPAHPMVERVQVNYPDRAIEVWGWDLGWLTIFLILSVAFALLLKRPLKVTF